MYDSDRLKKKCEKFLITLYLLSDKTVGQEINREKIFDIIGTNFDERRQIPGILANERFVEWKNHIQISISLKGIIGVEKLMESTYAEREFSVLEAIYRISNKKPEEMVLINDLAKALEMSFYEINPILNDLENRKGLIGSIEDTVWILPAGIEEIEKIKRNPERPTDNFPANVTNNYTFNAPVGAFQNNTLNSTQNVNQKIAVNNNSDFNAAIESILDLVKISSLANFKKEDLISDIERIKQLAENEPSSELVEHAKSKIDYLEKAIKTTDLAIKITPFIPQLYAYFEGLAK